MPAELFETVDVLLPGVGETLNQAVATHWQASESVSAQIYLGQRGQEEVMLHLSGLTADQRRLLTERPVIVDAGWAHHVIDGYGVRIPGILVTPRGTVIAVCQQRVGSLADGGHATNVLVTRSEDGGRNWSRQQVLFAEAGINTFLGPILADRYTNDVFVTFWKLPQAEGNGLGYFAPYAEMGGGFWMVRSSDEGHSWSEPYFVRPAPNAEGWVAWVNNSSHGVQLARGPRAGRHVISAFLFKAGEEGQAPGVRGGLVYSDDHGETWTVGTVLPEGSDEVSLVETAGGEIYVSYRRNTCRRDGRTFARSRDGGASFCELGEHEDLSGRPVHVGLARHGAAADNHPDVLLFSHPVGVNHRIPGGADMTIYVSQDDGRTWPMSKLIDKRPCRYSDLAVTADGTVLCIYTVGEMRDSEKLTLARFNQEWLFA
jgi:sialidase-1